MADDYPSTPELESREPTVEDLRDLCRELNRLTARYVVVGGFAMRMKAITHREKDTEDLMFLRHWFEQRGEEPPSIK